MHHAWRRMCRSPVHVRQARQHRGERPAAPARRAPGIACACRASHVLHRTQQLLARDIWRCSVRCGAVRRQPTRVVRPLAPQPPPSHREQRIIACALYPALPGAVPCRPPTTARSVAAAAATHSRDDAAVVFSHPGLQGCAGSSQSCRAALLSECAAAVGVPRGAPLRSSASTGRSGTRVRGGCGWQLMRLQAAPCTARLEHHRHC